MPSPQHKLRSSTTSLGRAYPAGVAVRRGDLTISDPILIPQEVNNSLGYQDNVTGLSNPSPTSLRKSDGTWPRKSVSPAFHTRSQSSGSHGQFDPRTKSYTTPTRASAGFSMFTDSRSSIRPKAYPSKPKSNGFRATIRRFFGSKRERNTLYKERGGPYRSVSCIQDPSYILLIIPPV